MKELTKQQMKRLLEEKLSHYFGVSPQEATYEHYYRALATLLRDLLRQERKQMDRRANEQGSKKIYYLCMEFLMGRSLKNNLYNLNLTATAQAALEDFGIKLDGLYDYEPDAGLGNGGLGRLAACYLDALATQGYSAIGYSILFEYGIFKQKLVDGWQTELPDFWLPGGEVWLVPRNERAVEVCFEGTVQDIWEEDYHSVELVNCKKVRAVPYDMYVPGKDGKGVSVLRLWSAKAPGLDMEKFNQGDYMRAMEQTAMAEVISKVLYPADNHPEGKSLRLRQQYFLVSAAVQDIVRRQLNGTCRVENLPSEIAIHINDTHPTMAIPEFMRILLDECGYGWDAAWDIVQGIFAYTNHTVMGEALEVWPEDLVKRLLPRIYQIIKEIDNRYRSAVWEATHDAQRVERMAVIANGAVRMANLCVASCHSVNGVSALHSDIIKKSVFNDFYTLAPEKFRNVTNGIAHRRWLCQANPRLASLIEDLIGDDYIRDASALSKLAEFADDAGVLEQLGTIKTANKEDLAALIKKTNGIALNPAAIFDIQVKRLHEYKRQHLNAIHILSRYLAIKADPAGTFTPHVYIFGAKAAPGYFMAKKIISFICELAELINNDKDVDGRLQVVYMEDYNVTMAERLMPAAEFSEQISLAGTEASGTGNMKLMLNGAVTIGTLDGANVEIREAVGEENILIFGLTTREADALKRDGYVPQKYYNNNADLRRAIDYINKGINGKPFGEIGGTLLHHDPYMVLADYEDYRRTQAAAEALWLDAPRFRRMSLINIAGAGRFAADRAVKDYADTIWNAQPVNDA